MKIIFWNCRGALRPPVLGYLRFLLRKHKPDVLLLAESHLEAGNLPSFFRSFCSNWQHAYIPAVGASGGILSLWKQGLGLVTALSCSRQALHLVFTLPSKCPVLISAVYASTSARERLKLWQELIAVSSIQWPWMVVGDFNCILSQNDKFGGSPVRWSNSLMHFFDTLSFGGLRDLGFSGNSFTWSNHRAGSNLILERLDRGLVNIPWSLAFPDTFITHLPILASDHCPLLINNMSLIIRRNSPWRFQNFRFQRPDCKDLIVSSWTPGLGCDRNLNYTRSSLIKWNKHVIGNLDSNVSRLSSSLDSLLDKQSKLGLSFQEEDLLASTKQLLEDTLVQQEILWRQKSRIQWLQQGDSNTKNFHLSTIIRRQVNHIRAISVRDNLITSHPMIKSECVKFFQKRWQAHSELAIHNISGIPCSISDSLNEDLTRLPTESEIKQAVFSFPANKAPGPDGFNSDFFRAYWDVIKGDLISDIHSFFLTGRLPIGWNETLITLIPKKEHPLSFSDFRPISLCNHKYKIVAKILANRLKPLMDMLIPSSQFAFIPGRQAKDNVLLTQELLHSLSRVSGKNSLMALKLDLDKAFDSVSWEALDCIMQLLGFCEKWRDWIWECISSSTISILVNGDKADPFKPSRGLRQGDPLSPYLFLLATLVIHSELEISLTSGDISGMVSPIDGSRFSAVAFADDFFVITKASLLDAWGLRALFRKVESISGFKINPSKSCICFSPKYPVKQRKMILRALQMTWAPLPWKHLGLPVHGKRILSYHFNFLLDKVQSKLAGWKTHLLSQAGRLILIQTVLKAIPSYCLGACWIPTGVLEKIEKLCRSFLWAKSGTSHGLHLVSWSKVNSPKKLGGLGLTPLVQQQNKMLVKTLYRLLTDEEALWAKWIKQKYSLSSQSWNSISHSNLSLTIKHSICSGLQFLESISDTAPSTTLEEADWPWGCIWKICIPLKVKLFLWKLLHNALPTGKLLRHRLGLGFLSCPWCGALEEDISHIFFECIKAKHVWATVLSLFGVRPDLSYLRASCSSVQARSLDLNTAARMAWLLWIMWKARCKMQFQQVHTSSSSIIAEATLAANQYLRYCPLQNAAQHVPSPSSASVFAWCDGSFSSANEVAGGAWILATTSGLLVLVFRRFRGLLTKVLIGLLSWCVLMLVTATGRGLFIRMFIPCLYRII